MWETVLNELVQGLVSLGFKLGSALIVFVVGMRLVKWLIAKMVAGKGYGQLDSSVQTFLKSFFTIGLDVLVVLTVIYLLGIPMASVLTVLASAGVAIGLALQGALSNFAGGILILIFKPFRVGDYIMTGEFEGTVVEITVIYTVLLTVDQKRITIPNGTLTNAAVVNHSAQELRRVDLPVVISDHADVGQAMKVLETVVGQIPAVLPEPAADVKLLSQKERGIELCIRAWCKMDDYWDIYFELQERSLVELVKAGIELSDTKISVYTKEG